MRFKDRVVIVTGGSKGIGKAIAKVLAAAGAEVTITSRNSNELSAAKEEISALAKNSCHTLVADHSLWQNTDQVAKQIAEKAMIQE